MLRFTSKENQSSDFTISDLTGREVMNKQINAEAGENEYSIDISGLVKRIYFLKVGTTEGEIIKRIVRN